MSDSISELWELSPPIYFPRRDFSFSFLSPLLSSFLILLASTGSKWHINTSRCKCPHPEKHCVFVDTQALIRNLIPRMTLTRPEKKILRIILGDLTPSSNSFDFKYARHKNFQNLSRNNALQRGSLIRKICRVSFPIYVRVRRSLTPIELLPPRCDLGMTLHSARENAGLGAKKP